MADIYGDQFIVLSEYINNATKIKLQCNHCHNIIYKIPVKMTGAEREGCYICSGKNHYKTKETLQAEADVKFPNTYQIIGEYVKARQPLKVKRLDCGHEYAISPDNLLRGKGCPLCDIHHSSYMRLTESILNKHNITYEREKRFKDCKNIRPLPFDYYLPQYNMCIEVDGEFHYKNSGSFFYENNYDDVKKRDEIKTCYCKDNNIHLLRLPYFEKDNFETLILDAISQHRDN